FVRIAVPSSRALHCYTNIPYSCSFCNEKQCLINQLTMYIPLRQRKGKRDASTLTGSTFGADCSTVRSNNRLDDSKAQPTASIRARTGPVATEETVEDIR